MSIKSPDWRNFDVQLVGDGYTQTILSEGYATLLALDKNGKVVPYLAKSWKVTLNSVTFTLRNDATCADGTPVTPTVVTNSFQRMIDVKAPYNTILFGPGPYTISGDDVAGTFTFSVATPFSDLLYAFVNVFPSSLTGIICPAGLVDPNQLKTKWFGAGPYVLVSAVHGDAITLKLRPDFKWGPLGITAQSGMPATVILKIISNETTAANLLLTGGLDVASITGPDAARLLGDKSFGNAISHSFVEQSLNFNELPGNPGADIKVRQALITAVDPKVYFQAWTDGRGRLSSSFVTPDVQCYDPDTAKLLPKPSLDAARQILQSDGYTLSNGKFVKDGQPLTVQFLAGSGSAGAEYIVNQFTQLGVTVKSDLVDPAAFALGLTNGKFQATILGTTSPAPIPGPAAARIAGPLPPQGTNFWRTQDPVLDGELKAARSTMGSESCGHWKTFQQTLIGKYHFLPVGAADSYTFSKTFDLSLVGSPSVVPMYILKTKK